MAATVLNLDENWFVREDGGEHVGSWLPVSRIPTNIHIELLENNVIEDPFLDLNELKCQWVSESSWTYRTILRSIPTIPPGYNIVLAMDGLDTFVNVTLNGKSLFESHNMFLSHRRDISKDIATQGENVLQLHFSSAFKQARQIKEQHPKHKWICWNGDSSRLAVRKAQYHWGWDWGPVLSPCGPWRPIRIEIFRTRVTDIRIDYQLNKKLDAVEGNIVAEIEGSTDSDIRVEIYDGEKVVFSEDLPISSGNSPSHKFAISSPKLWYPHGYGDQHLYTVSAFVISANQDQFTVKKRIGFRRIELIQQNDSIGKTFYFRVNERDVFCGGCNWIPADSFIPRISDERYRTWLQTVIDGNQIMIRIWGGGIYEEDVFYDLCDDLGILVWQDFMFACGNYPAFTEFLDSVRQEAIQNVRRLRHHACVTIFAGNNEDYQVQESEGLTYNYDDKNPENWLKTNFPARYIYEKILPEVMKVEAPQITYHPGSPWKNGVKTSNPELGDMHQWNVWHGTQEKYQTYDSLGGRFISEFGMEAFPHLQTIKEYCTDKTQLYPQSRTNDFHNKAAGQERRVAIYVAENFRSATSLGGYIHLTQLVQAEALMFGYRGWRKQWGESRLCGGALVWQLNDCWPATSWSIIDYYQRKKPAYFTIRRALAPIAISVRRELWNWSDAHTRAPKSLQWECWAVSKEPHVTQATVELRFISVNNGKDIKPSIRREIEIQPNGTTPVLNGDIQESLEEAYVLAARVWIGENLVSRDCDWPQPFKYLDFQDRGLRVDVHESKSEIEVSTEKPVKGLVFEEKDGVSFGDNCLDVMPGDPQIVKAATLRIDATSLKWYYVGQVSEL